MQLSHVLLFFTTCIGLAIFLYWIIPLGSKKIFHYRHNARKKRLIAELINKSITQRSKFRIEVLSGDLEGTSCEGVCSISGNNQINIELIETFAAQQLKHCHCRIFFQIMQSKKVAFFHFNSTCLNTSRRKDFTNAVFSIPTHIESGQKRKSLRCVPPSGSIQGIGLWQLGPSEPLPNNKKNLSKPTFTYNPRQDSIIRLQNISAGGMRLLFRQSYDEDEHSKKVKLGEQMLCLLLINTEHSEKKQLSILATCYVISERYLKKERSWQIGFRFVTWANINEGKNEIVWFPNDENGCIAPLAPTILHWNIKQNQKDSI